MAVKLPVKSNKIKEILPHRYPFLLVDRITELEENKIVGYKNVSHNEPFFNGHFPDLPIMPGVLQVEALAQTAGLYGPLYNPEEAEANQDKLGVFTKANNGSFETPVVPGDQLRLEVNITEVEKNQKGATKRVVAQGTATVDGNVTCRAELEFSMIPKKLLTR